MDLLDRLLGHDTWTTRQLLERCVHLRDEDLDRELDIGLRSLRATFAHVIRNMEVWSALMAGDEIEQPTDETIAGMIERLDRAGERLAAVARGVAERGAWDEPWTDHLDDPPRERSFGTAIVHVLTHSMHHRAQILLMLKSAGLRELPEGDVFSWENRSRNS